MSDFKNIMRIAGAFVGVVVGAGFASGQETLQFFSSFGYWGLVGGIVSGLLFVLLALAIADLSQVHVSDSYKAGIYLICGKHLGLLVDIMITFFLFAIAVVMFAGGGSLLEQQWGIPSMYGSVAVMLVTVFIVCLRADKVITFMGAITPLLVAMVVIVSIYSWTTRSVPLDELDVLAQTQPKGASHWLVAALLYVSYNMVVGTPFLLILGGQATSRRNALWGGAVGGALLGLLVLVIGTGVFARIEETGSAPLPMLKLATEMSPWLGTSMAIVIFGMILNTAVGVLYSFSARLMPVETTRFRVGTAVAGLVAIFGAKLGFITLVGIVYPFFGYLGFVLMAAILMGWWRLRHAAGLIKHET